MRATIAALGGLVLFLGCAETASAGAPVTWQSSRGSATNPVTNLQSDGTSPIGTTFEFELGAFKNLPDGSPFIPTITNVAEWENQWCSIGAAASYNGSPNNFFTRTVQLDNNVAPFEVGAPAYVWGYDSRDGGGEWLLVRSDQWTWPSSVGGGGINPGSTSFTISASFTDLEPIVGEINGSGFLMKTGEVVLPTGTTYAQWVTTNFTAAEQADPAISGETADADADGFSNLFEFATGSTPKDASSLPECTVEITASGETRIIVSENPDAQVTWSLEVSSDLDTWVSTVPPVPGASDLAAGTRTFVDPVLMSGSERRFRRLAVTSQ